MPSSPPLEPRSTVDGGGVSSGEVSSESPELLRGLVAARYAPWVGALAALLGLCCAACLFLLCCRRRRKRPQEEQRQRASKVFAKQPTWRRSQHESERSPHRRCLPTSAADDWPLPSPEINVAFAGGASDLVDVRRLSTTTARVGTLEANVLAEAAAAEGPDAGRLLYDHEQPPPPPLPPSSATSSRRSRLGSMGGLVSSRRGSSATSYSRAELRAARSGALGDDVLEAITLPRDELSTVSVHDPPTSFRRGSSSYYTARASSYCTARERSCSECDGLGE